MATKKKPAAAGDIQKRVKQTEVLIAQRVLERTHSIHTGLACLFTRHNQISIGDGTANAGSGKTLLNEQLTSSIGLDPDSPAVFSITLHEFSVPEMIRGAAFPDLENKTFHVQDVGILHPDVRVARIGEVNY